MFNLEETGGTYPAFKIWYFSSRYRKIAIWKCNFLISVIELWPHCSTCQWHIGLLYYIDNLQVNLTWKSVEFKGFKNDLFLCNCETYFIQNTHSLFYWPHVWNVRMQVSCLDIHLNERLGWRTNRPTFKCNWNRNHPFLKYKS